jgi:hypothetical protein
VTRIEEIARMPLGSSTASIDQREPD